MSKRIFSLPTLALLLCMTLFALPTHAQKRKKKKGKSGAQAAAPKKKKEGANYEDLVKKCEKFEGLFTVYRDTVSGASYLELSEEQLNKEYIYFSHVENGLVEVGLFRGSYRGSKIIKFKKFYDSIEIYAANTKFYFDPESALYKAKDANVNEPLLASLKIKSTHKDEKIWLLDADAIFLGETISAVKPRGFGGKPGPLSKLSKSKTKINSIKSFPENTVVQVDYVYDQSNPKIGGPAIKDGRYVTITYQHSLIAVPENDFVPRRDDPRIGYFMTSVDDQTAFGPTPYRDMIHRWNLVKKDPLAAVSDPVEPITWWIENTTPEEFRPIIKEGVERWNEAFAKAGFSNAVVVNIQPDDAEWEAGDIRYNVLRWTSSPNPPFGGYGPSFVNPRTGEIMGADIMLEFNSIRGRLFRKTVFDKAGLISDEDYEEQAALGDPHFCSAGSHSAQTLMFGLHTMTAMNIDKATQDEFVKQNLYRLVLHEVGHTLGLSHNMRASSIRSMEEIKDKELIMKEGLCNTVMEYPAVNFPLNKDDYTLFYDVKPGVYDHWIIEYGYSPAMQNPSDEERRLESILKRSTEPTLAFGNDADDMRSTGRGIDPMVNIYDLSSDPVAYAAERCELVRQTMPKIKDAYTTDGESFQELYNAYMVLTSEYGTQLRIMTRQIGGVHYNRAQPGQTTDMAPYTPVEEAKQKAAMKALAKYAFAPDAMDAPAGLLN